MKAEGKLITFDEVGSIVAELRREGKTIVTTNGSFDIVHVGHSPSGKSRFERLVNLMSGTEGKTKLKDQACLLEPVLVVRDSLPQKNGD